MIESYSYSLSYDEERRLINEGHYIRNFDDALRITQNEYNDINCILYATGVSDIGALYAQAQWISVGDYIDLIDERYRTQSEFEEFWNKDGNKMPRSLLYYAEDYALSNGGTLNDKEGNNSTFFTWLYLAFKTFIPGIIICWVSWYIFTDGWFLFILFGIWIVIVIFNIIKSSIKRDRDLMHRYTYGDFMKYRKSREEYSGEPYDERLIYLIYQYVDGGKNYE